MIVFNKQNNNTLSGAGNEKRRQSCKTGVKRITF